MTDDRLAHLTEVAPALWPAPNTVRLGRGDRSEAPRVDEFLLLPSSRRPRLIAPTGRRASAALVRHHGEGRGRAGRLKTTALSLGLQMGLGTVLCRERLQVAGPPGAPTLVGRIGEVLGREVVMGMHLGPPRANRKPVLQLLSPAGRTLAYAKLGVDALTDSLVQSEAAALTGLATGNLLVIEVPELLHAGTWQGHHLMVQSALPVWSPRAPLAEDRLVGAVAEIAGLERVDQVPLRVSPYWADLTGSTRRLPPDESSRHLAGLLRRLDEAGGDTPMSFGGGHGDFAPWNMACLTDRLLVWDWERFRARVPVGFDLLHYALQHDLVVRGTDPAEAAARLVDDITGRLVRLDLAPRTALVTTALYLADLAGRYLADQQLEAGARFGDVSAYLLPALDRGIGHLEGEQR
jgi:hypothetical protein